MLSYTYILIETEKGTYIEKAIYSKEGDSNSYVYTISIIQNFTAKLWFHDVYTYFSIKHHHNYFIIFLEYNFTEWSRITNAYIFTGIYNNLYISVASRYHHWFQYQRLMEYLSRYYHIYISIDLNIISFN